MNVSYDIYSGNTSGGSVNYSAVLARVNDLFWSAAPLPPSSTITYAVRAVDPATNLEEHNVDAQVTIVTDAAGVDITNRPPPPIALTVTPIVGAGLRIEWQYPIPLATLAASLPTGFHVYRGTGGTPSYTTPVATAGFVRGLTKYRVNLTGLTDGTTYAVGVRAFNLTAEEPNVIFVTATADGTGPLPVSGLAVSLTAQAG